MSTADEVTVGEARPRGGGRRSDEETWEHIRDARGKFAAMAATYSLGVFNDNFFKQAAMLLNVSVQGRVIFVFTLPYLLFAAYAGWLADRFSKRRIVISAKVLELVAMVLGAIGICTLDWTLILAMAFTMGLQSAIFGPSLNGSIPELYPAEYVIKANALLKMVVTASILAGVALAGPVLDIGASDEPGAAVTVGGVPLGRVVVASAVLLVALAGVLLSFGVVRRPAADPEVGFPWLGPVYTICELFRIGRDKLLAMVILSDVFIWSTGALVIVLINYMGEEQFGFRKTITGTLVAAELVGIAIGGGLSGRLAKGTGWYRILPPAALVLGCLMLMMAFVPVLPEGVRVTVLYILLGATGMAGGIFMIPCESFIQVRPDARRKGTVIAASSFVVFAGIMLSGPLGDFLNKHLAPTNSFAILGGCALAAGVALLVILPTCESIRPSQVSDDD